MHLESTTNLQLADARHQARVRAAALRHVALEAQADRHFLRRPTRLSIRRLARL